MIGVQPVFVDVERETLCMDVAHAQAAVTDKTKAIMLVTANGRYPRAGIHAFEELCRERGLVLIEDAAQSLGSYYPDGRHIGLAGVIGSFSFSAPKVISTGQGGALVTNDGQYATKLRRLKDFGRSGGGNDIHNTIGFNSKFTDLQACVGLAQMKKLDARVQRKKEIYGTYMQHLADCDQLSFFDQDLEHTTPWFIDVLADRRDDLALHLKERGVGTRPMYSPINRQEAYEYPGVYPVSEEIGRRGLWLPSAAQLTDMKIEVVCRLIIDFYRGKM